MARKQRRQRGRKPVKIPSVYRYMTLGLLLPIFVSIGMLYGYSFGQAYGEFGAAVFATLGTIAGFSISTLVIVKVGLFWDKKIMNQTKPAVARQHRKDDQI